MQFEQQRERVPNKERVPQHGTVSEYTNHGCRCEDCRDANRRRSRARKARIRGDVKLTPLPKFDDKVHPVAAVFANFCPASETTVFKAYKGRVLENPVRYRQCVERGIPVRLVDWYGESETPCLYALQNFKSVTATLGQNQKAALGALFLDTLNGELADKNVSRYVRSDRRVDHDSIGSCLLAECLDVHARTILYAYRVYRFSPEDFPKILDGTLGVAPAYTASRNADSDADTVMDGDSADREQWIAALASVQGTVAGLTRSLDGALNSVPTSEVRILYTRVNSSIRMLKQLKNQFKERISKGKD